MDYLWTSARKKIILLAAVSVPSSQMQEKSQEAKDGLLFFPVTLPRTRPCGTWQQAP